eukprot:7391853-Prymnesium_polylepis.3
MSRRPPTFCEWAVRFAAKAELAAAKLRSTPGGHERNKEEEGVFTAEATTCTGTREGRCPIRASRHVSPDQSVRHKRDACHGARGRHTCMHANTQH